MFIGMLEDVYREAGGCLKGGWRMFIGRLDEATRRQETEAISLLLLPLRSSNTLMVFLPSLLPVLNIFYPVITSLLFIFSYPKSQHCNNLHSVLVF